MATEEFIILSYVCKFVQLFAWSCFFGILLFACLSVCLFVWLLMVKVHILHHRKHYLILSCLTWYACRRWHFLFFYCGMVGRRGWGTEDGWGISFKHWYSHAVVLFTTYVRSYGALCYLSWFVTFLVHDRFYVHAFSVICHQKWYKVTKENGSKNGTLENREGEESGWVDEVDVVGVIGLLLI